ncbi:hypothetical protein HN873_033583, partial [Arachis hypogaea]
AAAVRAVGAVRGLALPAFTSSVRPSWLLCFVGLKQISAVSPLAVVSPVAVVSLVAVRASIKG